MKNDKEFESLKKSLRRERIFVEAEQRDKLIDSILKEFKHIDIFYIRSENPANFVKFLDEKAIIIWDIKYWDVFTEYVRCAENCRLTGGNLTQCVIINMAEFLSGKYSFCNEISAFLKQISENFSGEDYNEEIIEFVQFHVRIAQFFSLFHELAHIESRRSNREFLICRELVLDMFSSLSEKDLTFLGRWGELGRRVTKLDSEKSGEILEEIVADVFAIIHTIDLLNISFSVSKWKLACCCAVAIEYLLTFQKMFGIINSAWDAHLAEIMFGLPVRMHEIDPFINELGIARYDLNFWILENVINIKLELSEEQTEALWEYREVHHVDNERVVDCLADEEFICTAIEEAFMKGN